MGSLRIAIGALLYGDQAAAYLNYFLPSIRDQDTDDLALLLLDNSPAGEELNGVAVKRFGFGENYERSPSNTGFAKGHNILLAKAIALGCRYYICANADIILEKGCIRALSQALENEPRLGSASPKILKWDYENNAKTGLIDSCGIIMQPGFRFSDLGQGETDRGQYDNAEIIGPSGALAAYRIDALEMIKDEYGYFDSRMFMYKEDCDLAFRLKLAGRPSRLVSGAVAYHDRTVASAGSSTLAVLRGRFAKSQQAKEWSLLNQHLIYRKYWIKTGIKDKLLIIFDIIRMLVFNIIFDRKLLAAYRKLPSFIRRGGFKV